MVEKSKWYVSCVGKLCQTLSMGVQPPKVFEAKGVLKTSYGEAVFITKEIK